MKRISSLSIIFVLAGLIISSCSSNMSLTKRRYNKGYYVEHHKRNRAESKNNPVEKVAVQKTNEPAQVLPLAKAQNATSSQSVKKIPQEQRNIAANAVKQAKKSGPAKTKMSLSDKKALINFVLKNPGKSIKALPEKLGTAATADDALSLLWVVIVVLLILYLLSFLFNGFGLGGVVHLLGVIIVVLLILWLLRIL